MVYVQGGVSSADLLQSTVNDAKITTQLRYNCRDFLSVTQHLHGLSVRIISDAERSLNLFRESPKRNIQTSLY